MYHAVPHPAQSLGFLQNEPFWCMTALVSYYETNICYDLVTHLADQLKNATTFHCLLFNKNFHADLIKFSWANPWICNTVTIHVSIVKNIQTSLSMIYHNTSGDNDSDRASRRLYVNQPRRFCSWPWLLKKTPPAIPCLGFAEIGPHVLVGCVPPPPWCWWRSPNQSNPKRPQSPLCRPWNTNSTKTPLGHLDYI